MKTISIHSFLLLVIHFLTGPSLPGEVTDPIGAMLVPVMGDGRASIICSGGFIQAKDSSGMGNVTSELVFEIADANWIAGAFASSHYLQLSTGEWAGIIENTSTQLSLERALPVVDDVSYRIIPFNTLDSLFGPDNEAGFTGGTRLAESDILLPWDSSGQRYAGYFYFNTFRKRWEDLQNNAAGDTILYPDEALIVVGRTTKDIVLRGTVQMGSTTGFIAGNSGTTIIPNPYPFDIQINQSNLESVLKGAATFAEADWLLNWNPVLQAYSEFYYFDNKDHLWRDLNNAPADSNDVIPSGQGILVIKNSPSDGLWFMGQPFEVR